MPLEKGRVPSQFYLRQIHSATVTIILAYNKASCLSVYQHSIVCITTSPNTPAQIPDLNTH